MRISILTPSFNQAAFLERNIKSVINQDATGVEHIVADACSTDETVAILRRFSDQVQWVSEKDNGQADALNKALARATGEIIGWLNVDEYYEPRIFGKVIDAFEKNPDVVLVYGDFRRVTPEGSTIRVNRQWRFDFDVCQVQTPIIQNCAAFFRREHLIKCGSFDSSWHFLMDWELYVRFMRGKQRWIKFNQVFGNFTMHPQAKTSAQPEGFKREIERFRKREFPDWTPEKIENCRRKQEWRMRYHMLLDGVLAEKVWFKLVRQKKYRNLFQLPGKETRFLSPILRWMTGEKN